MVAPIVVTPPATPLVSLDAIKTYCRVDGTADDDLLAMLVTTATEQVEKFISRSLITRTLKLTLDAFPTVSNNAWWDGVRQGAIAELVRGAAPIALPRGPLIGVVSITTFGNDGMGSLFPALSYRVEPVGNRVVLASGLAWPSSYRSSAGIEVVYTAGYGSAPANVPSSLVTACMMQVAAMYEVRDCGELCPSAMRLAQPYRVFPMGGA